MEWIANPDEPRKLPLRVAIAAVISPRRDNLHCSEVGGRPALKSVVTVRTATPGVSCPGL